MLSLYAQYQYSGWASIQRDVKRAQTLFLDHSEMQTPSKWDVSLFQAGELLQFNIPANRGMTSAPNWRGFWACRICMGMQHFRESPLYVQSFHVCTLIAYTSIFQGVNRWYLGYFYTFQPV